MFASDRDLLVVEPNLFRDIAWLSQRVLRASGAIAGTTLTISAADGAFDTAGVGPGSIVTVDGVAYEVIDRLSAMQATISRPRASTLDPILPPTAVTGKDTWVITFAPQIAAVHAEILARLGIGAEAGGPDEAAITNPGALRRLEVLGTLAMVWGAAAALQGQGSPAAERAEWYRARFARERESVGVRLDLDGDGQVDAARHLGSTRMVRG
ncbi:MAG: hypothetical protein IT436_16810 [Phycisphaerales bacterium]|nr:hypothetical protein [Phycisphaerales bacterium]